ncbi:hypothetical protein BKE38_06610 [Pseudoroseomonas deserti]|uniref:Uncharacterized protein n=1 Tax=Teichococcus deserti TaxID=1817963 RepID=A0A1V2H5Q6_9PROT|nr:hypothetical protein BKE38_06610 [Pseudoroseomonas deserti]
MLGTALLAGGGLLLTSLVARAMDHLVLPHLPTYTATATLPDAAARVTLDVYPLPGLPGEYARRLRFAGPAGNATVTPAADAGGYSRVSLYRTPRGSLAVVTMLGEDFFYDAAAGSVRSLRSYVGGERVDGAFTYLGAFDFVETAGRQGVHFRLVSPDEQAECNPAKSAVAACPRLRAARRE